MSLDLKCCVCEKPALGVCCSMWGPVSDAYCRACLDAGLDRYEYMVGGLVGCGSPFKLENVVSELHPNIHAILKHYGKTLEEFAAEVDKIEREYIEHMEKLDALEPID